MDLRLGDIAEGNIVDFTYEGKGVVKIDKFIIFVLGGVIGDKVSFKVTNMKKSFGEGEVIEVLEPSKDRTREEMEIKEAVGGMPLVEYDYEKGLEWKREKVQRDLEKIAKIKDIDVKPTIGMDNPYRYRNNVQIAVGVEDSKTVVGFFEFGTNDIVDMEESVLISEKANTALKTIRKWIDKHDIEPYNRDTRKGLLRDIGIRTNYKDDIMVILVATRKDIPHMDELIRELKEKDVVSIYRNTNTAKSSITYGSDYKLLSGDEALMDKIGDYEFKVSPESFLQINRTQAEILYNKVIEFLEPKKEDRIVDLYSGIGTISIFIAGKAKEVIAVESVGQAVEDAKHNAELNDIKNISFTRARAEVLFPKLATDEDLDLDKIVLNPPSKGCEKEVLEAIIDADPQRIVYVSCNSATLARDLGYLTENGYKLKEAQPVDMFPHTAHVECVVLIEKE